MQKTIQTHEIPQKLLDRYGNNLRQILLLIWIIMCQILIRICVFFVVSEVYRYCRTGSLPLEHVH